MSGNSTNGYSTRKKPIQESPDQQNTFVPDPVPLVQNPVVPPEFPGNSG